jgi:hypothetical protein
MDLHTMSLPELKKLAKNHTPKIKYYYIKSRLELIQILRMNELPDSFRIDKLKIGELREQAKEKGFKNIWKLKRSELVDLLYPRLEQNNKNDDSGEKHDDPEQSDSD